MAAIANKSKLISILHQCFECQKNYSTPQTLRQHLHKHGIQLPNLTTGIRRYSNGQYTYVKSTTSHSDIEKHFGCPACTTHYLAIDNLKAHYYTSHLDTFEEQTLQEVPTIEQSHNRTDQTSKRRLSTALESELMDSSCLSFTLPDHDDHLLAENFNVTVAFNHLQLSLSQQKWKLTLEDHIHLAMATNHILLLTPNQYPEDQSPYFNDTNLDATVKVIEAKYNIKKLSMTMKTTTSMIRIVEDLTMKVIQKNRRLHVFWRWTFQQMKTNSKNV